MHRSGNSLTNYNHLILKVHENITSIALQHSENRKKSLILSCLTMQIICALN